MRKIEILSSQKESIVPSPINTMTVFHRQSVNPTIYPSIIYPSMRRIIVDYDLGTHWIQIDYIPWNENPLVVFEKEIISRTTIKSFKPRSHEWRYKGKIYHRDVLNNVWQKKSGKMTWIGTYNPITDEFNTSAIEPV